MNVRDYILLTVGNMVIDFLYYDRKEDGELPVGEIEVALKDGSVTIDEIVNEFRMKLMKLIEGIG